MPPAIRVLFAADGHETVHAAIRSISRAARDLERVQSRAAKSSANSNVTVREASKATRAIEKEAAAIERAKSKMATVAAREAQKAAQAEIRAAQNAAKQIASIRERSATMAGQIAARQVRQEQQAMAKHNASQSRMAKGAGQMLGRSARGTIGTVTGMAGTLGLAGGGMMIGNGVMNALDLQRQAALLSNSTSMPGAPGMDPKALVGIARGVAGNTGFKAGDVMEGMNTVSARAGGAKGLNAFKGDVEDVAKTAIAAGVSMQDMGAVYAASLNAGVKPGEEMRQLMMDLVAQGKEGAVEFADLAGELAKLAGAGKSWGSGAQMIRRASGMAQVAVEAAVSPEEARTAVKDMVREFAQGPKLAKLKAAGVTVEGEGGKNRDPMDLLAETIHAAETKGIGGSKGQAGLSNIFTGASQMSIISTLRENYLNGYTGKDGKSYKGKEAVSRRIADASSGTMTEAQRNAEFQKVMATDMQKVAVAMEKFGGEMDKLLPKISEMIPNVTKVVEGMAKLAVWATENPFTALGAIFGAHLAKELAGAGIAKTFEVGIANMLSGKGIKGNAGGTLASLGAIAITATAVYLTAAKVIDEALEEQKRQGADKYTKITEAENYLNSTKNFVGPLSPEQEKKALGHAEALRSIQAEEKEGWTDKLGKGDITGAIFRSTFMGRMHEQAAEGAGGRSAAEDPAKLLSGFDTFLKASGVIMNAAEKMASSGGSLASPGNPARTAPASSMSTGK